MILRKILKIITGLFLLFAAIIGITSINHPIILKWLAGSARIIGKPVSSIVYTDGIANPQIMVFHVDSYWDKTGADYYLLYFPYAKEGRLKVISLNRKDNYVGSASGTNIRDYDFLLGRLFQSEVGSKFTPFNNDVKGYNFDPQLTFEKNQIRINLPPSVWELKYNSIRIVL